MFQKCLLILLITYLKNANSADDDTNSFLCSAKICSNYIDKYPCPELPDNCKIQNATHRGIMVPSNDPCNCCPSCLAISNVGDLCTPGEQGAAIPDSICGPGLTCIDSTCQTMKDKKTSMGCAYAQFDYDTRRKAGTIGSMELRPICDGDGYYAAYKCVPGLSCFCVDPFGNRIFGEAPFSSTVGYILKCECPRKYKSALKFFDRDELYPNEYFRCTNTGDYDTIQCIGDQCMCTDAFDGAPTYPTEESVHMSNISSLTLKNCFKKGVHLTGKYYYNCASEYVEIVKQIDEFIEAGFSEVFHIDFPSCDLDGNYAAVQSKTDENGTIYYCSDTNKQQIENYQSLTSKDMNCNCARTKLMLPDLIEEPECCLNGNFSPMQCRRGMCYCVDENGYQKFDKKPIEVPQDEVQQLSCYSKYASCIGTPT